MILSDGATLFFLFFTSSMLVVPPAGIVFFLFSGFSYYVICMLSQVIIRFLVGLSVR